MKCAVIYLLLGAALGAALGGTLAEPVYENTFCMQQRCPYDGDFRCKSSGQCIRPWNVCDQYSHCTDGSDEQNCGTPNFGCYGYLCDNRTRCLSYSSVCNGYTSCRDESDEGYCVQRSCPYDGDFKCSDGKCLRSSQVCNGYPGCQSEEDEQNCDPMPCPYNGYFRCGTGECIRTSYICNRYNNCRDGSDEINCTYRCPYDGDFEYNMTEFYYYGRLCFRSYEYCNYLWYFDIYYGYYFPYYFHAALPNCSMVPCPYDGDFRCPHSGVCIRSYQVCDGSYQCFDGEDEQNCTSLNNCRYNTWWCNQGYGCYSGSYICSQFNRQNFICAYNCSTSCGNATQDNSNIIICNGINDCADGSDEIDCYSRTCLAVDDFRCSSTGACIRQAQVCDGLMHCSDGSDETNCTLRNCFFPGDVKCRDNGSCIHSNMICNGINDCLDGSDEADCASRPCPYSDDRRCSDSQACIRADKWCNQRVDCMDGSDEENCYDTPCPYAGDFRCAYNGYCIRGYDVCDRYEHCLDGSDEGMNYCPEDFTLGIQWERTLTKTTNTHKCSDIHPSFKLSDVITRECLRNRTWAPVNISQCVMSSDSPIVLIVVVSLDTNSTSLVKSKQDIIIQEMKEMIIELPSVNVEIIQSVSSADVSLKITFEFSNLTTTELIGNIKYDMNVTILGNVSVVTAPQLTIFESTDVCQCPDSIILSTTPTGANDTESIDLVSVCTGKPCEYNSSNSDFIFQCAASFVGDGKICGKDSDGDGYPDMQLNCNDSHCVQDNCPTVHNPNQRLEACSNPQGTPSDDDGISIAAAVGITFAITLIISILFTLLIVYIVYKIKQSTTNNKPSTVSAVVNATASLPTTDSTIKATAKSPNDDYEYPENYKSTNDTTRYQKTPSAATMQPNPAYSLETFVQNDSNPVYENLN